MRFKIFIMQLLLQMTLHCQAQQITGTITDARREPIINASVQTFKNGVLKGGAVTDFDGKYVIKPLDTGFYDVKVSFIGYSSKTITGVMVSKDETTGLDIVLTPLSKQLKDVEVYSKPLIDKYKTNAILISREIRCKPTTQTADLVAISPGIYQTTRGQVLDNSGARSPGNVYIVDGVQVQNSAGMAQGQVQTVESIGLNGVAATRKNTTGNTAEYKKVYENDFMMVKSTPLSTMSVDVDRASYSNIRRFITDGENPPADAVRIEEMINYFTYDYPAPANDQPIAVQTELTICPWNAKHNLLRIGIKAKEPQLDSLPPSNIVFLIDVSGSMNEPKRLPLVKESLKLLVANMRPQDRVSLVAYAGNAGLVLPSTAGSNKTAILEAIDRLEAGGSTAGGAGIALAYQVAEANYITGGNNRVILATDGDFNVGVSSDAELEDMITKKRSTGIFLTCLGVGEDNYKDAKMEMLADKGNGNYDYLDNIDEAKKTLVKEFKGTMFTVAKDVKAQIEFNPLNVQSYRLVGYENRVLNTEDFKDDKKDAGDMGAGHLVTVLYELVPSDIANDEERPTDELRYQRRRHKIEAYSNETATIKFRYKEPDENTSKELRHVITDEEKNFDAATENTRWAATVALFGMVLKESKYKGTASYDDVLKMAAGSVGTDVEGYRAEMVKLVKQAKENNERTSKK